LQKNKSFRNDLHRECLLTEHKEKAHRIHAASGEANKEYSATLVEAITKISRMAISCVMFVSVCPSVHMKQLCSNWKVFFKKKYDIGGFFLKSAEKIQFSLKLTTITGTFHEDRYTFIIISR